MGSDLQSFHRFTGILSQNGLWKLLPKGSQSETKEVPETAQRVFLTSAKGRKQLILVQGVSVWLWRRMMLLAAVKFPVFDAFLKNSEEMTGLLGVRRLNDKILSVSDSSPSKCKSDTSSFTVTMLTAAKKNQNNRLGAAASSQKKKTKLKSCWPHRMSILPSFNLFQMMKSQSSFPLNRKRSHCCCKTECCDHWTWTCALEKKSKKHQLTSDNSSLLHFTTSVSPRQIQVNHLQKYCTEEQITGLENTANQSKVHPRHFPSRDQSCTLEKEQRKSQCAPWPWSTLQHPLLWKHPQKSCHLHSKLDCSRSNRQAEARWDPAQEDLC